MRSPIVIGNCSGFYGDRISAAQEMVDGGPIDVLTGDYLAELTMMILWKARRKDPRKGYATTFVRQLEDVLGTCLDRGIRIVTNAGGLNPAALAEEIGTLADVMGLSASVAYVRGDDITAAIPDMLADGVELANLDTGVALRDSTRETVVANAYLGGWGIAEALGSGADIVICPRVTDASLVVGPSAWWHGWRRDDWDELAGAVAAGHVIECGPQATGGNYSFDNEVRPGYPGFPIAEVAADGSSVITKHPGTGGTVSSGTVTAQLLYEIGEPAYLNPDVVAHFDQLRLEDQGPDRVRISGCRGHAPPPDLKVSLIGDGGYRNSVTMVLTGLDISDRAHRAETMLFEVLGGKSQFDEVDIHLLRFDRPDPPTNDQAVAHLRVTVKSHDESIVGRAFSNAAMELALASYAGFHVTAPPSVASAFGVYWPCLVPRSCVVHEVVLADGTVLWVANPPTAARPQLDSAHLKTTVSSAARQHVPHDVSAAPRATTVRAPLGAVCGARSGDKGGNANIGVWTTTADRFAWLSEFLTVERFRSLVPETEDLPVHRYQLPNLSALNFVVIGLLGEGVSSSTLPDAQAKGLGEYLRSRSVDFPAHLLTQQSGSAIRT